MPSSPTQCKATQSNATQSNAMQCDVMQCNAMQCNPMLCSTFMQGHAMQRNVTTGDATQCIEARLQPTYLELWRASTTRNVNISVGTLIRHSARWGSEEQFCWKLSSTRRHAACIVNLSRCVARPIVFRQILLKLDIHRLNID